MKFADSFDSLNLYLTIPDWGKEKKYYRERGGTHIRRFNPEDIFIMTHWVVPSALSAL